MADMAGSVTGILETKLESLRIYENRISFIMTDNVVWLFATCDGIQSALSFHIFLKVYDWTFWLLVFISALAITIILSFVTIRNSCATVWSFCKLFYGYFINVIGILMEVGQEVQSGIITRYLNVKSTLYYKLKLEFGH